MVDTNWKEKKPTINQLRSNRFSQHPPSTKDPRHPNPTPRQLKHWIQRLLHRSDLQNMEIHPHHG